MRLLFVTFWNMDDAATNGIAKKIFAQRAAFARLGAEVDLCYAQNGSYYLERGGEQIRLCATLRYTTRIAAARALAGYLRREKPAYDAAYIRYALADGGLAKLTSVLRDLGAQTVIEIPTYPYEKEFQTLIARLSLFMDKLYRARVAKRIGRYVIYTDYDRVYGTETIKTSNGVDPSAYSAAKQTDSDGVIRLICVATFAARHGCDRLLRGLSAYRVNGGKRKFSIAFVGDGPESKRYRLMAEELGLGADVRFFGPLGGAALNAAYDRADLGVDALAFFRIGVPASTTLKFFEYLTRGLPVITTGRSEPHPSLEPYTLKVSADESPIDFNAIADFYDRLYGTPDPMLRERIRAESLPLCEMSATLRPVYTYLSWEDAK